MIINNWQIKKIKEVAGFNELSINDYKYQEIEYIDIASVKEGRIIEKKIIKFGDAPSRAKRILRNNDIIISTVRPNLKHYAFIKDVKENTICSTGFVVITSKKVDPRFLYYYLTQDSFTDFLSQIAEAHTSAYPAFNPDIIEDSEILLPEMSEQISVGKILYSIDKKIEVNNNINHILEQISQAIFKHWFVDFEFPDEQSKPYKSSGGEFIDSEIGKIPKGWDVGFLKDFNIEVGSGRWGSEKYSDKDNLKISCMRGVDLAEINAGRLINLPKRFISASDIKNSLLRHGDIVIEISGGSPAQSTGRVLFISKEIINFYNNKLICSNFCKVIRTSSIFESYYIYNLLKLLYEKGIFFNFESGTTGIKNLDFKFLFSRHKIVIPDRRIVEYFFCKTHNLISGIYNNAIQNDKLSQIRDTLLPKLITGKIRVNLEDVKES